jgi:hypothetical protein
MTKGVALVGLIMLLPSGTSRAQTVQDPAATLIMQAVEVTQPLGPCEAADVVGVIARVTGVPAGIEHVPGDCDYRHSARSPIRQSLQGLSVRDALDQIVRWDPRYRWQVLEGVISFRPLAARNRPDHFLHTSTGDVELVDENIAGALAAISAILGANDMARPAGRTPLAEKRFSLSLSSVSALAALDAVVKQHGAMWWEVRYCKPEVSRRYATVNLWTFDKGGLGYRLDQSFRARNAPDPCADNVVQPL